MFQWKNERRGSKRASLKHRGLGQIESLERRELMAADLGLAPTAEIEHSSSGPALLITGTNSNDRVTVYNGANEDVIVAASSVVNGVQHAQTYSFHGSDFDEIKFVGLKGNDYLYCGTHNDLTAAGGEGNDIIHGCHGTNKLHGNGGNDQLNGKEKDDTLRGGAGDDRILGKGGDDLIVGGVGDDRLFGGAGNDDMTGADQTSIDPFASECDYMHGGDGYVWMRGAPGVNFM